MRWGSLKETPSARSVSVPQRIVERALGSPRADTSWAARSQTAAIQAPTEFAHPTGEPWEAATPVEAAPPGQTALFNNWEDAVECARCMGG